MTKPSPERLAAISNWPDWTIMLAFFLYPLIVGLLIQLVLLPFVFRAWNAGDGLLVGLDSVRFNRSAVMQAQRILAQGWQAWSLAPDGQSVVGIASIFYVLIAPHPWVLLPLNALLHALAGWTIYKTLRFFLEKRLFALLGALPFLLFPSSLNWVAQMHNDNYAVTGAILLAYGCVCFARRESWKDRKLIVSAILALLAGGVLIWLVRGYVIDMFTAVGLIVLAFLVIVFVVRLIRSRWTWKQTLLAFGVTLLSFFAVISMQAVKLPVERVSGNARTNRTQESQWPQDTSFIAVVNNFEWHKTAWLPSWVDAQMQKLSQQRTGLLYIWTNYQTSNSNFDTDVSFHSAWDIIRYLPRATQVGFLAPFPTDWFGQGSKAPNTMMRRVTGIEMFFVYLSWPGLLYAVWTWRRRPELWTWLGFCAAMMVIYVLGSPNMGTLYRFRYPFIMPLVGLGVAGWSVLIGKLSSRLDKLRKPAVT